ncbi:MAG: hypothetical protein AB7G93_16815 [Bdellovibrionales bacterium]
MINLRVVLNLAVCGFALVPVLILGQNCVPSSKVKHSAAESSTQTSAHGGHGTGYDGKLFVYGSCQDGHESDSEKAIFVDLNAKTAALVRDECADLAPPYQEFKLTDQQYSESAPEVVNLNGIVYSDVASSRKYIAACKRVRSRSTVDLFLWRDASNALFGEVIENDPSDRRFARTQPQGLRERSRGSKELEFESVARWDGHDMLGGTLNLKSSTVNANYSLPELREWEVMVGVPCTINP